MKMTKMAALAQGLETMVSRRFCWFKSFIHFYITFFVVPGLIWENWCLTRQVSGFKLSVCIISYFIYFLNKELFGQSSVSKNDVPVQPQSTADLPRTPPSTAAPESQDQTTTVKTTPYLFPNEGNEELEVKCLPFSVINLSNINCMNELYILLCNDVIYDKLFVL